MSRGTEGQVVVASACRVLFPWVARGRNGIAECDGVTGNRVNHCDRSLQEERWVHEGSAREQAYVGSMKGNAGFRGVCMRFPKTPIAPLERQGACFVDSQVLGSLGSTDTSNIKTKETELSRQPEMNSN